MVKFQSIWKFLEKGYKGKFKNKLKNKKWEPFWKSPIISHATSFFGFNFLQRKYALERKIKILYTLPVTLGFYRITSWDQHKLRTPGNFNSELKSSLLDPNIDLIVCPFDIYGLYQENMFQLNVRHATCLIFDKITKTVEYYDPMENSEDVSIDTEKIHQTLKKYMDNTVELNGYEFVSLYTMGYEGFQYIEEMSSEFEEYSVGGLCFIWSLFYAELRMKYPDEPCSALIKDYIQNTNTDTLKNFIHDYALYIYDNMLKDESFKRNLPFTMEVVTDNIKKYFMNGLKEDEEIHALSPVRPVLKPAVKKNAKLEVKRVVVKQAVVKPEVKKQVRSPKKTITKYEWN